MPEILPKPPHHTSWAAMLGSPLVQLAQDVRREPIRGYATLVGVVVASALWTYGLCQWYRADPEVPGRVFYGVAIAGSAILAGCVRFFYRTNARVSAGCLLAIAVGAAVGAFADTFWPSATHTENDFWPLEMFGWALLSCPGWAIGIVSVELLRNLFGKRIQKDRSE